MRQLVFPYRYEVRLVDEDIRGLEDRIAEKSVRAQIAVLHLFPFFLIGWIPFQPGDRNHHGEQEMQDGMFRDTRLHEHRGFCGIDACGKQVDQQLVDELSDAAGIGIATYALRTLAFFAFALLTGRLVSSLLLGVFRINSFVLLTAGSALTTLALIVSFTTSTPSVVRIGLIAAGFGMGPIFPTSVGLASVMMPRMAGTAMSLVMGVGFAGLLLIPPAVGYISTAAGGEVGDVRTGLIAVMAASGVMLLLHALLAWRERRLGLMS